MGTAANMCPGIGGGGSVAMVPCPAKYSPANTRRGSGTRSAYASPRSCGRRDGRPFAARYRRITHRRSTHRPAEEAARSLPVCPMVRFEPTAG